MKILSVNTPKPNIRSKILAWWSQEDLDLDFSEGKPIGLTSSPKLDSLPLTPFWIPKTILEALHRDWELLGPPRLKYQRGSGELYEWWLVHPWLK